MSDYPDNSDSSVSPEQFGESEQNPEQKSDSNDSSGTFDDSEAMKIAIEHLFEKTNEDGVKCVVQNIEEADIIDVNTTPMLHGLFMTMLFRNRRFSVSFSKWVLPMILSAESMSYMDVSLSKVFVVKFYDQDTFRESAVDTIIVVPSQSKEFYFLLKLLVEFKSYRDDEEPLQSCSYVIQAYRNELAQQRQTNKEHPGGNVRRKPRLNPYCRIHLCNAKTDDMGVVSFDDYFSHLPEVIQRDLRPYTHFPDELPLNLATMPIEDIPVDEDVPELYAGLFAAKAVNEKDVNELLDHVFNYLIENRDRFLTHQDFLEFSQLILQYNDHYSRSLEEKKIYRLCERVIQSTGDSNVPDLFLKKYKEGYVAGVQTKEKEYLGIIDQYAQERDQRAQEAENAKHDVLFLQRAFRGVIIGCLKDVFPGQDVSSSAAMLERVTNPESLNVLYSALPGCRSLSEFESRIRSCLPD